MFFIFLNSLKVVSRLLRLVPLRVRGWLGDALGWVVVTFFPFRRELIRTQMVSAFGTERTEKEIDKLVVQNYQNYVRTLLDFIVSITWSPRDYLSKVTVTGYEAIRDSFKVDRGVYVVSCHLGAWEVAVATGAALGFKVDLIVKQSSSAFIEKFLQWFRSKTGANIYWESHSHHGILKGISNGNLEVFVMDQFMGPPIGLPSTFFGQLAGTAASLALMVERRPAPIFIGYCYRGENGQLHVNFKPINFSTLSESRTERLYQRTQTFNDEIEAAVRCYPSQWMWLHRRWKSYRGEPRWKLSKSLVTAVILAFLSGACTTAGPELTGIEIPNDPVMVVPKKESVRQPDPEAVEQGQKFGFIKKGESASAKPAEEMKSKENPKVKETEPKEFAITPIEDIPFAIGEEMEFDLTWVALPAGRAIMGVKDGGTVGDRPVFVLWGNVVSSRIVDAIYHVDNSIESFTDARGLIPYKYLLHMVESKQLKETKVVFNHVDATATFWSKRISERWGNEEINQVDPLTPGSRDMWAALYFTRTLDYELNKTFKFPIYEKNKTFNIELTAVDNELIRSKAGVFQCWKVQVRVYLDNVLKQAGDTYMWLSDDSRRFLVRFDAKLKIGSLKGELVRLKEK